MLELKNSKTIQLGKNKFALDAFIGAVQMSEDGQIWEDIKPQLIRDTDGWHIEGAPYYAEVKDDGTRLFCPDRNERSRFLRLSNTTLLAPLTKYVIGMPAKLDGQVLDSNIVMPALWGEIRFIFTNTGMKFEVLMNEPPEISGKTFDKFTFDHDAAGLDFIQLLSSEQGLGIPRPRLIDADDGERWLDWSYKAGQLELGFDLTGLKFPVLLKNTTIDEQVGAGADDLLLRITPNRVDLDAYSSWIGSYNSSNYQYGLAHRFSVALPNACTIDTAYLSYRALSNQSNTICYSRITAEDVDSAAQYTEVYGDEIARYNNHTTAVVDWDSIGAWTSGNWYNSPEIKAVVQEIVNRAGWSSGNYIGFYTQDYDNRSSTSAAREITNYEGGSSNATKVHIEYAAGGGGAGAKRGWWSK